MFLRPGFTMALRAEAPDRRVNGKVLDWLRLAIGKQKQRVFEAL